MTDREAEHLQEPRKGEAAEFIYGGGMIPFNPTWVTYYWSGLWQMLCPHFCFLIYKTTRISLLHQRYALKSK